MKKMLKENKGFSLVELLIALLIMAVIAGTAITLFGGVLDTSKGGADRETAEAIKRAILTYMNAANDTNLSALGVTSTSTAQDLVDALGMKTVISTSGATRTVTNTDSSVSPTLTITTSIADDNDIDGTYGPFLERSGIKPAQQNMTGWVININTSTQVITVQSSATQSLTIN